MVVDLTSVVVAGPAFLLSSGQWEGPARSGLPDWRLPAQQPSLAAYLTVTSRGFWAWLWPWLQRNGLIPPRDSQSDALGRWRCGLLRPEFGQSMPSGSEFCPVVIGPAEYLHDGLALPSG